MFSSVHYKKRDDGEAPLGSWTKGVVTFISSVPVDNSGAESDAIDLASNLYERLHLQIIATWPPSPVDDLKIQIQSSLDGISFDDEYSTFTISKTDTGKALSFQVANVPLFRIRAVATGATDSITIDSIKYRAQ